MILIIPGKWYYYASAEVLLNKPKMISFTKKGKKAFASTG